MYTLIRAYNPFLFFCTFFYYSAFVCSQSPQWNIYNTVNSGLPDNYVNAIGIDKHGNKWIGTNLGLTRFDGRNWITYNRKTTKDIQFSIIKSLNIDSRGDVWTGTTGDGMATLLVSKEAISENTGASFYDYTNDKYKTNPDKIVSPAKWIYYKTKNSAMPNNSVKSIFIDQEGTKWIGTEGGLVRLSTVSWGDGGAGGGLRWSVFDTTNSGLPHNAIYSITQDSMGNFWFGTFGKGLVKYDGEYWTVYDIRNSPLPDDYIVSLTTDKDNAIWIGTYSGGLVRFDGNNWTSYKTSNSDIHENLVFSLASDKFGNIWVGSINSGLSKFDGKNWQHYELLENGTAYTVSFIYIDEQNNKWIGTAGGLAVFNENGLKL